MRAHQPDAKLAVTDGHHGPDEEAAEAKIRRVFVCETLYQRIRCHRQHTTTHDLRKPVGSSTRRSGR